ncbi:MAG: T9SS type A sorting domain-containing protein [Bacteroidales bacterium]
MKSIAFSMAFLWVNATVLLGQSFSFTMPTSQFVLIPGGGFESRVSVTVPPGDSVILTATCPQGLMAVFQPAVVHHSQDVFLVVISTDSALAQQQTLHVCARHLNDSITKTIWINDANDGHGFYLIDSARILLDTAFGYLKHIFPTQKIFINSVEQLPWTGCFPYPPLIIVTHHLFVSGNWRATVLWHNMVPPDNWEKVYIYNEQTDSCYGVHIDTWGVFSTIPCEKQHYTIQDVNFSIPEKAPGPEMTCKPNPTSDIINIKLNQGFSTPVRLQLLNTAGQLLRDVVIFEKEYILDLGQEPPGMYVLMAKSASGFKAVKILKQ